jgi:hypothetical protein
VRALDLFHPDEVRDGAGDAQDAGVAACGKPHALRRLGQQLDAGRFRRGDAVQQFDFGFGIGANLFAIEALRSMVQALTPPLELRSGNSKKTANGKIGTGAKQCLKR